MRSIPVIICLLIFGTFAAPAGVGQEEQQKAQSTRGIVSVLVADQQPLVNIPPSTTVETPTTEVQSGNAGAITTQQSTQEKKVFLVQLRKLLHLGPNQLVF